MLKPCKRSVFRLQTIERFVRGRDAVICQITLTIVTFATAKKTWVRGRVRTVPNFILFVTNLIVHTFWGALTSARPIYDVPIDS